MKTFFSFIALAGLILSLGSCSLFRNSDINKQIQRVELINTPLMDTVESKIQLDVFIVYLKINNHEEPLEFLFDTGANLTVINQSTANRLGLTQTGTISLGDSKGVRQSIPLVNLDTVQLGQGLYTNVIAAVFPIDSNSTISCIAKDGILGYHVIRQLNWYAHPGDTLLVGSSGPLSSETSHHVVSMPGKKSPRLDVTFNGLQYGGVLFDTGSNGGLDLELRTIVPHIDSCLFETQIDGSSQGLYGNVIDTVQRINGSNVGVGEIQLPSNVEFTAIEGRKIGMRSFLTHSFVIAGPEEELHISKSPIAESKGPLGYGMIPGLSDTTLYIATISTYGQAVDKGLEMGQILKSLNGLSGREIAEMPCGYVDFIIGTLKNSERITIETKSGEIIELIKTTPHARQLKIISE